MPSSEDTNQWLRNSNNPPDLAGFRRFLDDLEGNLPLEETLNASVESIQ